MSSLYYYYEDRTLFFDLLQPKSKIFEWFWKSTFGKRPHTICLFLENNEGQMQETNASFSKRPQAIYKKRLKTKAACEQAFGGPKSTFDKRPQAICLFLEKHLGSAKGGPKRKERGKRGKKRGPKGGAKR